jgi:hypothetical protein
MITAVAKVVDQDRAKAFWTATVGFDGTRYALGQWA